MTRFMGEAGAVYAEKHYLRTIYTPNEEKPDNLSEARYFLVGVARFELAAS